MSTSRRGFLKGIIGTGAAASAATALPACAPDINPAPVTDVTASSTGDVDLLVTRYPDLEPVGGALTVRVPGEAQPLLVVHPAENTFAVLSSLCTHVGCPLGYDGTYVVCPCHLSRFSTADGAALQKPATVPLRKYKSEYNPGTKVLTIRLKAGDDTFPAAVNGTVTLTFSQFPQLRNNGSVVSGTPSGYGQLIFVSRLEDGTLTAVDSICTHAACTVEFSQSEGNLICPCHDSAFTKRGELVRGPAPGRAPIAPLKKFTVTETADAVVVSGVQ